MESKKLNVVAVWAIATFALAAVPGLQARAATGDVAASGATMSKQELKAQKKLSGKRVEQRKMRS
ncbi:hypothetical protein [Paraburkholderia kirstenboschensis]|uniref:hypothetical protein n=1 Tax=Paraburkholderia kirstenboschensis TaxID=1245436 RepID=UPI003743457D